MHYGKPHNPSRLDGPEERKKDRPKGPVPGGGTNPFRTPLVHKKLKSEQPGQNV